MNLYKKIVCGVFLSMFPFLVQAETRVGGVIMGDVVWSKAGSPYLIESDITVPDGETLTVEQGVSIRVAPEVDVGDVGYHPSIFVSGGLLNVEGSAQDRVSLVDLGALVIQGGSSGQGRMSMKYTDVSGGTEVAFQKSFGYVASSSVSGSYIGVHINKSAVDVTNTRLYNNTIGIYVDSSAPVYQVLNSDNKYSDRFAIGGYGDVFAEGDQVVASSTVTIHDSSFENNNEAAIYNFDSKTVDAVSNWWNSTLGPKNRGVDSIHGNILNDPWLTQKPADIETEKIAICCSNIIFIPGIEGTQLFDSNGRVWEPWGNNDVKKLYSNNLGSSTIPIITGDPISNAYGIKGIYGSFINFLDSMVASSTINEWKSFGYDWRKPVDQVVKGVEQRSTTTQSLVSLVEDEAKNSRTGKVTLVAHSNGGLVAKYLVKVLQDIGKLDLIDTVISVAVPALGTPQAISSLLHGDGQSILGGLIVDAATARGLALNTPSAYSLLPSREFFSHIFTPTIAFASTTIPSLLNGQYPKSITSSDDQNSYVTDSVDARKQADPGDVSFPITGNSLLMSFAQNLHTILDPFEWPLAIAEWSIAGWNKDTATGITYSEKSGCSGIFRTLLCGGQSISHRASTTNMGDGTVVTESALHDSRTSVMEDLAQVSGSEDESFNHANILESEATQSAIRSIVTGGGNTSKINSDIAKVSGLSIGTSNSKKDSVFLEVSTHSPVELHIYDKQGRHTGMIDKPSSFAGNDFVTGAYEEKIPGSSFKVTGEDGNNETYIRLPNGNGESYSVVIKGTDFGFFHAEIEQWKNDTSIEKVQYVLEPTSPLMIATTTIGGNLNQSAYRSIASTTPRLVVDIDGDGSADYISKPGGNGLPGNATTTDKALQEFFRLQADTMKKVSKTIRLRNDSRKDFGRRFGEWISRLESGRIKGERFAKVLSTHKTKHIDLKNIKNSDEDYLMDRFEGIIND